MFTSVFLLNIVYFSVCLTSNKLYWIEDQLADVSTRFYVSASWTIGELTVIHWMLCENLPLELLKFPGDSQNTAHANNNKWAKETPQSNKSNAIKEFHHYREETQRNRVAIYQR